MFSVRGHHLADYSSRDGKPRGSRHHLAKDIGAERAERHADADRPHER
jgi:hypothetical protein